jgi:cold shock CspA family protein
MLSQWGSIASEAAEVPMLHLSATIPLMPFDAEIVRWLNSAVGVNPRFDNLLHLLNGSALLKGAPFMVLIWWLGSGGEGEQTVRRDFLTRSIVGLLGPDVFVHVSAVERAGMRDLNEGQKIAYEIVADRRTRKSSADNLKPA